MAEFDTQKGTERGSIGLIFTPHKEEGDFDFERLKGVSNKTMEQLRGQLIHVRTIEVMPEDYMAKTLGGTRLL